MAVMIEGNLPNVPLMDVFQVVATGQKSGVLTLETDRHRARVYFELGRIQYAHITPGIHLGEIMVRMDLLTTHEVQELLERQQEDNAGTPLGLSAVATGLINQEDLKDALEAQVLEVLTELSSWRRGHFSFAERSLEASQIPTEHTLDAMMVLMEVARRSDEWQTDDLDPGAIFERAGDPTKMTLPEAAWDVIRLIDGKRPATAVAAELDIPEKQVYLIMLELQGRNVIQPVPYTLETPMVLLVSASDSLMPLLRLVLRRAQFDVKVVSDRDAAFEAMENEHPRVIVIDDYEHEGWSLVSEFRKLPGQRHLPIVLLTNNPAPNQGGFLGFGRRSSAKANILSKPFRELELQTLVSQLVGRAAT